MAWNGALRKRLARNEWLVVYQTKAPQISSDATFARKTIVKLTIQIFLSSQIINLLIKSVNNSVGTRGLKYSVNRGTICFTIYFPRPA
jgi:hypothetical protein